MNVHPQFMPIRNDYENPFRPLYVTSKEFPGAIGLSQDDADAMIAFGFFKSSWNAGLKAFDANASQSLMQALRSEDLDTVIAEGRRRLRLKEPGNWWMADQIEDAKRFPHHAVYFIRCDRYVKIGHSGSYVSRLRAMSAGNPKPMTIVGLLRGHEATERALHDKFARQHHHGEWFKFTQPVRIFVEIFCSQPGQALVLGVDRPSPVSAGRS